MVFSLTGSGLSVAGSAPERSTPTNWSTSLAVKLPEIWPSVRIGELIVGAETIKLSSTMARW